MIIFNVKVIIELNFSWVYDKSPVFFADLFLCQDHWYKACENTYRRNHLCFAYHVENKYLTDRLSALTAVRPSHRNPKLPLPRQHPYRQSP